MQCKEKQVCGAVYTIKENEHLDGGWMPTAEHLPSTGPVSGFRDLHGSWSLRASPRTHKVRNQRAAELTSSLIRGVIKGLQPSSRHHHSYAAGPGCWARPLSNAPGPTSARWFPWSTGLPGGSVRWEPPMFPSWVPWPALPEWLKRLCLPPATPGSPQALSLRSDIGDLGHQALWLVCLEKNETDQIKY